MIEVTILIPVADNSGDLFSQAHFAAFEAFVLDRFGGLTRAAQAAKGVWVDEGQRYNDELIVYVVATPSVLKDAGKLLEVIDFARQHFRQEAIFCRYLGVAEIL